jgi:hypothetical protein
MVNVAVGPVDDNALQMEEKKEEEKVDRNVKIKNVYSLWKTSEFWLRLGRSNMESHS